MTAAVESAQSELASLVGASRLVADPGECAALAVDGLSPKCVVYPASAEEAALVLKRASERGLAVIPCRNATKLGIGNLPRRYDIALSLKHLNRVWHYEPADLTVSVEPGMMLGDFQHFLGRRNLWLPLDPAASSRASLGGILATNSAGPLRLSYGAPRDMVLGVKVATTEGKVIKAGGRVVKNVAGYDLTKLLIGSYGTLGVIVEASLKLYPLPRERATFVFPAPTLEAARALRRQVLHSPLNPLRMVYVDAAAAAILAADLPEGRENATPQMWLEAGGSKRVIERFARALGELARAAGTPARQLEAEPGERAWGRVADFRAGFAGADSEVVILKSTLPLAASEEFLDRLQREFSNRKMRAACLSEPGVGIVHLGLMGERLGTDAPPLIERLRGVAETLGGVLIVERCLPQVKASVNVWGQPGSDFGIMRKLKETWDPKGILSPGRFVGGL